jgi:hypothetical protein
MSTKPAFGTCSEQHRSITRSQAILSAIARYSEFDRMSDPRNVGFRAAFGADGKRV